MTDHNSPPQAEVTKPPETQAQPEQQAQLETTAADSESAAVIPGAEPAEVDTAGQPSTSLPEADGPTGQDDVAATVEAASESGKPETDASEDASASDPAETKGAADKPAKKRGKGAKRSQEAPKSAFGDRFPRGARRSGFAPGEFVAGLVTKINGETLRIDLFDRGIAFRDINERDYTALSEAEREALEAKPQDGASPEQTAEAHVEPEQSPEEAVHAAGTEPTDTRVANETTSTAVEPLQASPTTEPSLPAAKNAEAPSLASESSADATPEAASNGTLPDAASESEPKSDEAIAEAAKRIVEPAPAPYAPTAAALSLDAKEPGVEAGAIVRGRVAAVAESGHVALVNTPVDEAVATRALDAARAERKRVVGLVYGYNRGGFDVLVEGVRTFCPASAIDAGPAHDPGPYLGRKFAFLVSPKRPKHGDIVVGRRSIAEREAKKRAAERFKALKVGDKLKGQVKSVRDFGIVVDLDGIDGFLHASELDYKRSTRPAQVAKPGDELEVEVIKLEAAQKKDKRAKVSLSRLAFVDDPWSEHAELLREGRPATAMVRRVTDFGAFLELADGIEGLLHVSLFGREGAPQVGSELRVVIDRVDARQRRISLSKLSESEDAWLKEQGEEAIVSAKKLKPGAQLEVLIERVEPKGLHLRVAGVLGRRGQGYMMNRDTGSFEEGQQKKMLQPGNKLDVKLVGFEKDGRLKLSRRALQLDEERNAVKAYRKEASKQGLGTFADVLRAKLEGITPADKN